MAGNYITLRHNLACLRRWGSLTIQFFLPWANLMKNITRYLEVWRSKPGHYGRKNTVAVRAGSLKSQTNRNSMYAREFPDHFYYNKVQLAKE
jgi:hypothetical protein